MRFLVVFIIFIIFITFFVSIISIIFTSSSSSSSSWFSPYRYYRYYNGPVGREPTRVEPTRVRRTWFLTFCRISHRLLYDRLRRLRRHRAPLNTNPAQHEQASLPSINPTCGVCWNQVAVDNFIQGKLMPECEHEANVCRSCLAQSVTESRLCNQLTCPLCTVRIDGSVVEKFTPSHTISR